MGRVLFLCLLAGLGHPCGTETVVSRPLPPPGQGHRLLFIGNSLTYENDLPSIVKALADAAGAELDAEAVIGPGFALEDHWANGSAQAAIRRGGWTVVVLQQGPSSLPGSRTNLIDYAGRFAEEIRRVRARPLASYGVLVNRPAKRPQAVGEMAVIGVAAARPGGVVDAVGHDDVHGAHTGRS